MNEPPEKKERPWLPDRERWANECHVSTLPRLNENFDGRKTEFQRLCDERLAEAARFERAGSLLLAQARQIRKLVRHA